MDRKEIDLDDRQTIGKLVRHGQTIERFPDVAMMLKMGVPSLRKISAITEYASLHLGYDATQSTTTLSRLISNIRSFASEVWPDCPRKLFAASKCGKAISYSEFEQHVCQSILQLMQEIGLATRNELDERSQMFRAVWKVV
jgi:hypothetical protein